MDIVIYVGIAVLLAVVLFVALGGKKAETEAKPSTDGKPAPKADQAKPKPLVGRDVKPKLDTSTEPDGDLVESISPEDEGRADAPPPPSSHKASEPPSEEPEVEEDVVEEKPRRVEILREGLFRSRDGEGFFGRLKALFTRRGELSPEIAEQIEEVLLSSDVGVATTASLIEGIKSQLGKGELSDHAAVWGAVRARATELLKVDGQSGGLRLSHRPTVVLLVGVNGAGKTTTIGKLATQLQAGGRKCVLAAGDTFRAAAVQQLVVWGERVGCEVVRGKDGADPGSVIFDAIKKATESKADVVLADTAGRLHTKANLMNEMQKIARTIGKAMEGAPHETLLVIDSTNGQNALAQAEEFKQKLDLTGIVLTKLDGTAKGGVVLGIANSLKLPVRFIGLGERPDDLHEFDAEEFVEALLGKDKDEE